jgi:hypothetical protein
VREIIRAGMSRVVVEASHLGDGAARFVCGDADEPPTR